MSDPLIKALKEKMGYTEEPAPRCEFCKYSAMHENPYLDRDWYWLCSYNKIEELHVAPGGRCDYFERKHK